ncbi:ribosomal protein S5 domain 2-type protein [Sphaerosporella brunnea]|uniref:Ribosomal protein S5 domain 2-type protein n=1 Tax=Sphaerosporella brunnea TaxID=1250544 RepID=A0A5J5FAY2_9PEZI|nr:ribosomal protein S5 domain 2-type protein [Sphaerosporella brunnea]
MAITASLSLLPRADGSATFKSGLTAVVASVSGPMEVKARDELPDKTFIEVIVRPAVGVGGTRERALESRLLAALSPLIILTHHPRTLLQINIQIVEAADHTDAIALLPVCINAATLALIDAGTPLKSVLVATTVLLDAEGQVVGEKVKGGSRHVLGFVRDGKCVFVESMGAFDEKAFGNAVQKGMSECALDAGDAMEVDGAETVGMVIRHAVEKKVGLDMRWRE